MRAAAGRALPGGGGIGRPDGESGRPGGGGIGRPEGEVGRAGAPAGTGAGRGAVRTGASARAGGHLDGSVLARRRPSCRPHPLTGHDALGSLGSGWSRRRCADGLGNAFGNAFGRFGFRCRCRLDHRRDRFGRRLLRGHGDRRLRFRRLGRRCRRLRRLGGLRRRRLLGGLCGFGGRGLGCRSLLAAAFLAGAFFSGFGSSGCSSRVKPSRWARRRTMSA